METTTTQEIIKVDLSGASVTAGADSEARKKLFIDALAAIGTIETQEQYAAAVQITRDCKAELAGVESTRKALNDKVLPITRKINEVASTYSDPIAAELKKAFVSIGVFHQKEEARVKAEEESRQAEIRRQLQLAEEARKESERLRRVAAEVERLRQETERREQAERERLALEQKNREEEAARAAEVAKQAAVQIAAPATATDAPDLFTHAAQAAPAAPVVIAPAQPVEDPAEAERRLKEAELAEERHMQAIMAQDEADERARQTEASAMALIRAPIPATEKPKGLLVAQKVKWEIEDEQKVYAVHPEWFNLVPKKAVINGIVHKDFKLDGMKVWEEVDINSRR